MVGDNGIEMCILEILILWWNNMGGGNGIEMCILEILILWWNNMGGGNGIREGGDNRFGTSRYSKT